MNGRGLETLGGCEGLLKAYEVGLKSALNLQQAGLLKKNKPIDYATAMKDVSCERLQAVLQTEAPKAAATWGPCMNYAPDQEAAHVAACIGSRTTGLIDCRAVRNLYEQKLRTANGGIFPPGYIAMDCNSAEGVIQAELKRQAEAKKKHEEIMAARRAAHAQRENVDRGDFKNALTRDFATSGKWVNNLAEHGIPSVLDGILPGDQSGWGLTAPVSTGAIIGFILWAAFKLGSKLAWDWVKRKVFKTR